LAGTLVAIIGWIEGRVLKKMGLAEGSSAA